MNKLFTTYIVIAACIVFNIHVNSALPKQESPKQRPRPTESVGSRMRSYKRQAHKSLQKGIKHSKRKMQQWGLLKKEKTPLKIYVCPDIEGVWQRVQTFITQCNGALTIIEEDNDPNPATNTFKTKFADNAIFVCLGDTIDKGPNGIKVLKFLNHMATTYPDRVVDLLGNRDINKIRLLLELSPEALNMRENKFALNKFRLNSWENDFTQWLAIRDGNVDNKVDGKYVEYQHGASPETDTVLKLKWMLQRNMGAADALSFFKKEYFGANAATTSDFDAYVQYLRVMLSPASGLLATYLTHAQAIYYNPRVKALFMHGGISADNIGYIIRTHVDITHPDYKAASRINIQTNQDLLTWVGELNERIAFCIQQGLNGYLSAAIPAIEYQEPQVVTNAAVLVEGKPLQTWGGPNPTSVVHGRPWNKRNNLAAMDPYLAATLYLADTLIVCYGHSPTEIPAILKTALSHVVTKKEFVNFLTVACDTTSAVPARNAAIIVSDHDVTVNATYYDAGVPRPLKYSSRNNLVGLPFELDGKMYWCISPLTETTMLIGHWSQAPGKTFNVPSFREYNTEAIARIIQGGQYEQIPTSGQAQPTSLSSAQLQLADEVNRFKILVKENPHSKLNIDNGFTHIWRSWEALKNNQPDKEVLELIQKYELIRDKEYPAHLRIYTTTDPRD